jgi:hypothetical protein
MIFLKSTMKAPENGFSIPRSLMCGKKRHVGCYGLRGYVCIDLFALGVQSDDEFWQVAAEKVSYGAHPKLNLTLTYVSLSSAVIRRLDEEGQTDQIPVIYYYFTPDVPETQTCDNFLRSLLFQLLYFSINIPAAIRDLHARHNLGTRRPSINDLTSCLVDLIGGHREIRIVGDGFDQCPEWNRLWKILTRLVQSQHASLRLLFTSRKELYIEDAARTLRIPSVDLRCQQVDNDIAKYVSDVLRDDSRFARVTAEMKDLIRERLTALASGRSAASTLFSRIF